MSDELNWEKSSFPDLEERAALFFVKNYDIPCPPEALDENGEIRKEVRSSPGYKGVIDGLLGRKNKVYDLPDDDQIAYASGYNQGEFMRNKFKHELLVQGICDHSLN